MFQATGDGGLYSSGGKTSSRALVVRNSGWLFACAGLAILASGCGSASVTYQAVSETPATDPGSTAALVEAAGNKAVVVNIPISRIMIVLSQKNPMISDSRRDLGGYADNGAPVRRNTLARATATGSPMLSPAVFVPAGRDYLLKVAATTKKPTTPQGGQNGAQGGAGGQQGGQQGSADGTTPTTSVITQTVTEGENVYAASVMPIPSDDLTLRVTPVNDFFSANDLAVTKLAGTDIPLSVSNQFTDLTQSRVTAIGSLVSTGLSLLSAAQVDTKQTCDPKFPATTIDADNEALTDGFHAIDPSHPECWAYRFVVGTHPHQADVVARASFKRYAFENRNLKAWPVPACLDGTMELSGPLAEGTSPQDRTVAVSIPLKIIDPAFVRLVGIPDKGAITMHPICDANVSDTPVNKWSEAFDTLTAMEAQAKAIKSAMPSKAPVKKPAATGS